MRFFIIVAIMLLSMFQNLVADKPNVIATLVSEQTAIEPGESFWVAAHLTMAKGWHTYWKNPGDSGLPTEIEWDLPQGVTAGAIFWPNPKVFYLEGLKNNGYEHEVYLLTKITLPKTFPLGQTLTLKAQVRWLECADVCIPGQGDIVLTLPVQAKALVNPIIQSVFHEILTQKEGGQATVPAVAEEAASTQLGFFLAVLLAFLGGLILNLMPCVLPVISLKVMSFIKHASDAPHTLWRHGVVFTLGILFSFWALVSFLMVLRSGGAQLGWGFQLQSPIFVMFLILFLFMFALNMFGVFELGGSLGRLANLTFGRGVYMESFMSGVLVTIVATPCTAPFMGPAMGFALTQPLVLAFVVFTALAVGLATPYLLLSLNPKWMKWIPKPGAWMVTLRQFMGFPLMATALWLLWVLSLQTSETIILKVLGAILLIAMSCWLHGCLQNRKSLVVVLVILIISGQWLMMAIRAKDESSVWQAFDASKIVSYRQEGQAVFVDFTAAWCLTCQVNKKTTLQRKDVLQLFADNDVILMKADWTRRDSEITQVLESFGRSGVPLYVFYSKDLSKDAVILPSLLAPQMIEDLF